MNRQQRRANGTKGKVPTYNYSQQQLEAEILKALQKTKVEVTQYVTTGLSAGFIMALHDEFGFGTKRLQRVLDEVTKTFQEMEEGIISLEDMVKWCKEEAKVVLNGQT